MQVFILVRENNDINHALNPNTASFDQPYTDALYCCLLLITNFVT